MAAEAHRILVVGGRDEFYGDMTDMDIFNTTTSRWEAPRPLFPLDAKQRTHGGQGQAVVLPQRPYTWLREGGGRHWGMDSPTV